ncbi:Dam family site-specific DNA-(adenine-N6)-methyltransferase [Enterococcus durans]|uniref:Dam family site-specific DNA-(adenine-N6)-methyltransferase n=1 Tax=Enterococcus durans TaxID=53345 RepID=UPI0018A04669|nr:Dam family site-specific DNA-(adenine-N6)-methyltransferase [Enterococcus durans]EHV9021645.1 DNA adenine methylase [Listeria monocytogenes]EHV9021905.1 DNA adenine methylase [Listeria monocytogenes]MDB1684413.1 Dam family site-specific DNA-(adenine-N6)-methyltransferase [Enterococcus durans]
MTKIPHLVQYQGSKRSLATTIASYFPDEYNRFIEPFSGTAAMSIYAASTGFEGDIIINDINHQIIDLLENCIENPEKLAEQYKEIWSRQFLEGENNVDYYNKMRSEFNKKKNNPEAALTLFILARVAKGAIRYNQQGEMNQICDKRRNGTQPKTILKNAVAISDLLKGRSHLYNRDYTEILDMAEPGDLVYMDPPYQGVSQGLSSRYIKSLEYENFVSSLELLNERGIDYIVSYDGHNDNKKFGLDLPEHLNLQHIHLNAGRSAQGNLNGKELTTYESLYISPNIRRDIQ